MNDELLEYIKKKKNKLDKYAVAEIKRMLKRYEKEKGDEDDYS